MLLCMHFSIDVMKTVTKYFHACDKAEMLFLVNPVFLEWISPPYKVAGNYLDHISWKIVTKIPDCAIPFVIVIILGSGVPEELS